MPIPLVNSIAAWFLKKRFHQIELFLKYPNEVQNEFYIRVQKTIQEFSLRFKEGWRTERGEILILYGEPDRVDKHHHIAGSEPYEIWFYENLNKKITFIDKKDNGDFKLVNIENIEE